MKKAKTTSTSRKKRRPAKRKRSGFGQAILTSLRGWERDRRFWASVRRKIAVARRQLAEGWTAKPRLAGLIADSEATPARPPSRGTRKSARPSRR